MAAFLVRSDYEVIDRSPLELDAGDRVKIGPEDADWPGWVWVLVESGRGSYVPKDHLEMITENTARVILPFNARDLSVRKGDSVESLRELKGWHWCRNMAGIEGWLPEYLLRPL